MPNDKPMNPYPCSRRSFLHTGAAMIAGTALSSCGLNNVPVISQPKKIHNTENAVVSIVRCRSYLQEIFEAYQNSFDLLGGIGTMVKNKTVTIKVNLTGRPIVNMYGKHNGESYLTHPHSVAALCQILFNEGAKKVRIVESAMFKEALEHALTVAEWDINELKSLGNVEFENTRNLGYAKEYAPLKVPNEGYLYNEIHFNHSYRDTDVFISLCKMKNHAVCGVTLAMKNLFGIIPNALYGDEKGNENAIKGRGIIHGFRDRSGIDQIFDTPGYKGLTLPINAGYRVPRAIADINAARPVHLSIIDGIKSVSGGEGPWNRTLIPTEPGVLICGLNPVSTDAVATSVMGYPDPLAHKSTPPFKPGDNHILLAHNMGVGTGNLDDIDVRGLTIRESIYPYQPSLVMAG